VGPPEVGLADLRAIAGEHWTLCSIGRIVRDATFGIFIKHREQRVEVVCRQVFVIDKDGAIRPIRGFGARIRLHRLMRLSIRKCYDVRRLQGGSIRLSQEARRDIPMPSIGSNDGHRFAIVAGQRAFDLTPLPVFKRHLIADRKFKHGLMRVYLMKKA
jgi:hypothetical protein